MSSVTRFIRQVPVSTTYYNADTVVGASSTLVFEFVPSGSNYVGNYPVAGSTSGGYVQAASAALQAAIAQAVKYVLGEKKVAETDTEVEEKPEKPAKGLKADDKKSEQVRKNIDASKSQPAKMDAVGLDANKKGGGEGDISSYTEAEFAALPESTKSRMRGDFIENGMAA